MQCRNIEAKIQQNFKNFKQKNAIRCGVLTKLGVKDVNFDFNSETS